MEILYSISFWFLTLVHIIMGLKGPLGKNFSNYIVNGKPGTGSTPIEEIVGSIMTTWYLGSGAGVIWAHYIGNAIARQGAIIICLFVHLKVFSKVFMSTERSRQEIVNPKSMTRNNELMLHGSLFVASM